MSLMWEAVVDSNDPVVLGQPVDSAPTADVPSAEVVEAARGYLAATEGYALTFRQGQWRARLAEAVAAPEGVPRPTS